MRLWKQIVLVWTLLCVAFGAAGQQDAVFSQFFNFKNLFNPAYASVPSGAELSAGYRRQWTGIQQGLQGAFAGANVRLCKVPIGLGLTVSNFWEPTFGYNIQEGALQIGSFASFSDAFSLHGGFQAAWGNRGVDYSRLVFSGQLDPLGFPTGGSGFVPPDIDRKQTFTIGAGLLVRGQFVVQKIEIPFSIGLAVQHLGSQSSRDVSFQNINSPLPARWTAHASVSLPLSEAYTRKLVMYVSPIVKLDIQGVLRQMAAGCMFQYNKAYLGVLFRSNPKYAGGSNTSSLLIAPGLEFSLNENARMTLGYSYDAPLGGLGLTATGGAHEICAVFTFPKACAFGSSSGRGKTNCYSFAGEGYQPFLN